MHTFNKTLMLFQLCLVTFGLAVGLSARADVAEVRANCDGCHGLIVTSPTSSFVIGNGSRVVPQRSTAEWVSTIERMNAKGAEVTGASATSIADYLASLGADTTLCYKADGTTITATATHFCPGGTSYVPAPICSSSMYLLSENQKWTCITKLPSLPVLCSSNAGTSTYYYYAAGNGLCL